MAAKSNLYQMDYPHLKEWMGKRSEKKLAHNTYARKNTYTNREEGDSIVVLYHGHPIATLYPGKTILDPCGWFTPTTKERLCWFTSQQQMNIFQRDYVWYLYQYGKWESPLGIISGKFTLYPDGKVEGLEKIKAKKTDRQRMVTRIQKYARAYVDNLVDGDLDKPGPGDCLYCAMQFTPDLPVESLWDMHLGSHLKERYYVPSLILNAIKNKPVSDMAKWVIGWRFFEGPAVDFALPIAKDQLYSALWKYLLECYDQRSQE